MKVGVTGHQRLGSANTVLWITIALDKIIEDYVITEGLTSLAKGADQLYAERLRQRGVPYTAIIPCQGYDTTFKSAVDLARFKTLLECAKDKITLSFERPHELAFFEAGKFIVNSSDLLIACWDGKPAKGAGGTGDIVSYAIQKGIGIIYINTIGKSIVTHPGPYDP